MHVLLRPLGSTRNPSQKGFRDISPIYPVWTGAGGMAGEQGQARLAEPDNTGRMYDRRTHRLNLNAGADRVVAAGPLEEHR